MTRKRMGSKVRKGRNEVQISYQPTLASPAVSAESKEPLREECQGVIPVVYRGGPWIMCKSCGGCVCTILRAPLFLW